MLTTLFTPNPDHMMVHYGKGDYTYAICHTQLIAWEYVKTKQFNFPNESSHDLNWVATTMH